MLAVVASAFSAIGALVTSKWGGKTSSTPTSIFAGAQSFGGALMLLFFSVVILVIRHGSYSIFQCLLATCFLLIHRWTVNILGNSMW